MYACVHTPSANICGEELFELALEFSPAIEKSGNDTVVFSITALRKLLGSPHQIACEICRLGYERNLNANLAIASNVDTAILLARNQVGVTLVTPGEESFKLAPLPLACLFVHDVAINPELMGVLTRWGLKTCGDLAGLPKQGIAERLGPSGIYLRDLASGRVERPLHVEAPETNYEERITLEHSINLLEPLLFLLGRALSELCRRLRSQSRAARTVKARLELEQQKEYCCELEFPVPLHESAAMLKLLQLHLERHPPHAPIAAFTLRVEPAEPRREQHGFFVPDKLQITLARIEGMVGKENVGAPMLLNTHRPDAFQMKALNVSETLQPSKAASRETHAEQQQMLRLAMRLFRPALHARVKVAGRAPKEVMATRVKGSVIQSAGPWKTSGEWWTSTAWAREEWDVALDDGGLYRIYRESETREWYVHAIYD